MLKSMTGYGRSKLQYDGKEYTIEIKSVNHRYVDICVKTPRNISYIEDKIAEAILDGVITPNKKVKISVDNDNIIIK